jgi:RHS repeat-associated protein
LVTQSNKTERWRWENDPFGRGDPVEYTVSGQDVSPDDDASSGTPLKYNTCCCGGGGCGAGCNQCQTSCSAGQCTGGGSQDVLWLKTYTVSGANNVRLHFSTFDVAAGTTRTGKDYVRLLKGSDGTTVVADLTGNLGDFWGPWAGVGESSIVMKLYGDNVQDNTRGFVVDKLEYTTATNGRFVMHLRMPGQVWDEEAKMSQNFHRWYRREDGRYLTPDPIGLAGGEPGYFGYAWHTSRAASEPGRVACENCERFSADEVAPASVVSQLAVGIRVSWLGLQSSPRPALWARSMSRTGFGTSGTKTTIDWKTSDDAFRGDVEVLDSFRDNMYCAENPGVCAPLGLEWSCLVYCASNACPVNGAEGRGLTMSVASMRAETAAKDEQLIFCESGLSSPLYCDLLACALVPVPLRRF